MSVRIISAGDQAVLYCSSSGWAFGPVFDSLEQAEAFLDWFDNRFGYDPRTISDVVLRERYETWLGEVEQ